MALVHRAVPDHPVDAATWLANTEDRRALRAALVLLPFGGIFFLWFMGAMRDFVGGREDRFFMTGFLGAGYLYVAMIFVFGATATAFLATIDDVEHTSQKIEFFHYGRHLTSSLLREYAPRMACVFALTTTTIGTRLGILPRWLSWLGYVAGLVLLTLVSSVVWAEMVFPVWVLVLGGYLTVAHIRHEPAENG